jgi:hypothetical protein
MWFDLLIGAEIFWHILDVFSQQGCPIELISFALGQASIDTSVEYRQHIIPRTWKIILFRVDPPPLVRLLKVFNEKK